MVLCIATSCDWLKKSRATFLTNHKLSQHQSHAFSRAWEWCRLHVFASSFDWFIGLSASIVIGQSNYFGFGFTTVK